MKDWEYYRRLTTTEYRNSPNYQAVLKKIIDFGMDSDAASLAVIESFDVDTAVGLQLDILGAIVGVNRMLTFQPSNESAVLDDDTYRLVIKCRIIKNHWKGSLAELYEMWDAILPEMQEVEIRDMQDMTLEVEINGDFAILKKELIYFGYIVPKPEGVHMNIVTSWRMKKYRGIGLAVQSSISHYHMSNIKNIDINQNLYFGGFIYETYEINGSGAM